MTTRNRLTLPAIETQYFAQTQTVVSGDLVLLNGDNHLIPFSNGGYARSISFSSTDNLSACTFTITGYSNAAVVIEIVGAGPNNNTIYSTQVYSSITSIQVNGANATNLKVGSGNKSIFPIAINSAVTNFGPGSYNFTINNPNGVAFGIQGTNYFIPAESMNNFLTGYNGIFTIEAYGNTSSNYRLDPSDAQILDTIFVTFASTGALPTYINFISV